MGTLGDYLEAKILDAVFGQTALPVDLSAQEAIDLLGYIAVQLPGKLAEARSPAARILVPSGLVGHG